MYTKRLAILTILTLLGHGARARAGTIVIGDYNGPSQPYASPSNPITLRINQGTYTGLPLPSQLTTVTLSGYFGNSASPYGTADVQVWLSNSLTGARLEARYITGYYSGPPLYWYYQFAPSQFASYFAGGQFSLSAVQTSPTAVRLGSLTLTYSTLPAGGGTSGGGGAGGPYGGLGAGGVVPEPSSWIMAATGLGTCGSIVLLRRGRRGLTA